MKRKIGYLLKLLFFSKYSQDSELAIYIVGHFHKIVFSVSTNSNFRTDVLQIQGKNLHKLLNHS